MSGILHNLAEHYRNWADKRSYEKIVKGLYSDTMKCCNEKKLSRHQIKQIQDYWYPLVGKQVDIRMHQMMLSLTGVFKPEYEPFEICREVQEMSMKPGAMRYFDDKNLYRRILNGFNIAERIVECYNGVYYLPSKDNNDQEVSYPEIINRINNIRDCIIKPSIGTDGGRGVRSFDTENGIEINDNRPVLQLINEYGCNFCIERKIHECENLQRLNPTSCNTLRVHTMRDRNEQRIRLLSSYVRIGKMGEVVDNMYFGGTGARIYDGGILKCSVSVYPFKKYTETESGVSLVDYKIDNFDRIVDTCISAHSRLPMFDLMGWDVTVDKNGNVVIIEFNPNPDIRIEQAIFGDTCLLDNQEWVMKQYYSK